MALTAQEKAELEALEREVGAKAHAVAQGMRTSPAGLTPEEQAEMQALEKDVGHMAQAPVQKAWGDRSIEDKFASLRNPTQEDKANALRGGAKILDYPGGILRTGLMSAAATVGGKPGVINDTDVGRAFRGEAPTSAEYLERMGVSEGYKVPDAVPLIGGTSGRDIEGFLLDVGTDPLTLLAKASTAARPIGVATEKLGEKAYKSGFKKIDEKLVEKNAKPLSDLLLAEGKTGSTKKLAQDAKEIASNALDERSKLYDKADKLGVTIDLGYPLKKAEQQLTKMRENPATRELADNLAEFMELYKKEGKVSLSKLSDWKTALYESLPSSAYDGAKVKGPAKQFEKALAADFKEAIEGAGNAAEKGLGDKIHALNEKVGTVLAARKPLNIQIGKGNTTNIATPVDAMLGAITPGALPLKKAADISKTTYARTKTGKGLIDMGKSGLLDSVARRGLIKKKKGQLEESERPPSLLQSEGHE